MLSFLREQGNLDLPAQKSHACPGKTPGDGTEKSKEQGYYTVATHGSKVRKSTIFLAVLFIIGLLGLWFMIKKSTPQAASAASVDTGETKIETAIAKLTGVKSEMFSRMDEIVRKFYEFSDVLQVEVNELVKNPFKLEMFLSNLKVEPEVKTEQLVQVDAESIWKQQIRQKAAQMQLLSIMRSDRGDCCMIDDEILYEGDSIEGFKIRQIGNNSVKLEWDTKKDSGHPETQIVLKLSGE